MCSGERQGSDDIDADECEELQQMTWWSKKKYRDRLTHLSRCPKITTLIQGFDARLVTDHF